jgi:siroheme synthase
MCFHSYLLQVFGRGGEEMDFLQQQGIKDEVIPGMQLP